MGLKGDLVSDAGIGSILAHKTRKNPIQPQISKVVKSPKKNRKKIKLLVARTTPCFYQGQNTSKQCPHQQEKKIRPWEKFGTTSE